MGSKRTGLVVVVISAIALLVLGVGIARARPPEQGGDQAGFTIPYAGRLANEAGQPVAAGNYAFTFALYGAEAGGEPLWSEAQDRVAVQDSTFLTHLGSANPLPAALLGSGDLWLAVGVRGPGEVDFALLSPRQQLHAAAPDLQAGTQQGAACAHDHWGESWSGSGDGLFLTSSDAIGFMARGHPAIYAESGMTQVPTPSGGNIAIYGYASDIGVYGWGTNYGVGGKSTAGIGVLGQSADSVGVKGESTTRAGVEGRSQLSTGVIGRSELAGTVDPSNPGGIGVYGENNAFWGIGVEGRADTYGYGVYGLSVSGTGVRAESDSGSALVALSSGGGGDFPSFIATIRARNDNAEGIAAYFEATSNKSTLELDQHGTGIALDLQTFGSGDSIVAYDAAVDAKFRVTSAGEVYADGQFHPGGADMAEMLPAVAGLEPGDVLVIGPDGQLARSTQPYQATVVGIYSTKPGFIGGAANGVDLTGKVPLAVVGVVPVKVSAENGAIRPGNLLVASATPGHAMRAGANPAVGTVIGKALAGLDKGTGVILMLVVLQ